MDGEGRKPEAGMPNDGKVSIRNSYAVIHALLLCSLLSAICCLLSAVLSSLLPATDEKESCKSNLPADHLRSRLGVSGGRPLFAAIIDHFLYGHGDG